MSITTTGYSVKRYTEIVNEIRQQLITATGNPNLDMSDSSILGIINNIYALPLSELHELAATQWSAGDPDTATGVALDRLVSRARITRLQEQKALGDLYFTDAIGKTLIAGTQIKDLAGNVVQTLAQLTLDTTGIVGTTVNITVVNNTTYTVTINGVQYTYLSDASATLSEITSGLIASLSNNPSLVCSVVSNRLSIQSTTTFNIIIGSNLSIHQVTKAVAGEALLASTELFESGTLNYPVNSIGSTTVTNRQNWSLGRLRETDSELRFRFKRSVGGQGNATVEAMFAKLNAVEGVLSATVEENWTMTTNSNGLPAKSVECTVKGGSDIAVARAVWQSKPAGIQPFGNTSYTIKDSQGIDQTISFTRPVDAYIHVRVDYLLYNEEVFPSNGLDMIVRAVKDYGDSLGVNNDIIPQRIMAAIYNRVQGINNLIVTVGKTSTPSGTPVLTSSIIPIGRKEEAVFDLSRIIVLPA